jgi:hypothetical protein
MGSSCDQVATLSTRLSAMQSAHWCLNARVWSVWTVGTEESCCLPALVVQGAPLSSSSVSSHRLIMVPHDCSTFIRSTPNAASYRARWTTRATLSQWVTPLRSHVSLGREGFGSLDCYVHGPPCCRAVRDPDPSLETLANTIIRPPQVYRLTAPNGDETDMTVRTKQN